MARRTIQSTPTMKKLITALQTGRHKLGMRDEEYRALLSGISGGRTSSTKELTEDELKKALNELRKVGFSPKASPQYKKLASLWFGGHDAGIIRNRSKEAMDAYIQRMAKRPPGQCDAQTLQRVIENLKQYLLREASAEAYQRLQRLFDDLEPKNAVLQ